MKHNSEKFGVVVIEGHVQGLANTRLLGKAGIPVIVLDKGDCLAKYSRYCSRYYKCPDYIKDEFADFLLRLNNAFSLNNWLLLPSNDHAVHTIARNKERLRKCYSIITEDIEIVDKIYNKRNLLRLAEKIGVPIPDTIMPEYENPTTVNLRFPILIKGNNGLSFYKRFKHKALRLETSSSLDQVWDKTLRGADPQDYFIQEQIPYDHKTVSVTVFAENGNVHSYWMGIKIREHPAMFGTATCCKSMFDEELLGLSKRLVSELRYTGVCEIEWLRDSRDNIPKLIEVNPRTWLWVGLAAKCGVNYPVIIYNYVMYGLLPNPICYSLDKIWLNVYTDLIYSIQRVFTGIDHLSDIVRSYYSFTEACWDSADPVPFFKYALLIGRFIKHR